jgi:hypothetical protein
MMKFTINEKFSKLMEKATSRYQNRGFLPGDIVKLKANAMSHEFFKDAASNFKELISNFLKDGARFKISIVKSGRGSNYGTDLGGDDECGDKYADIYREYAPGMWNCPLTLPLDVLEKIDRESDAEGYVAIDDKLAYNPKLQYKPIKADDFEWGEPNTKKKTSKKK